MTLGVSDKQPWQLQVTHNSDLRDILLYLNCFLICWVSRNIADKARSFCQPSSHQIICPAIYTLPYKNPLPLTPCFFCMYSWESLKSELCQVTGVSSESWMRTLLLLQCCPVTPTMATIMTLITRASWWCPPPPWVWLQPRCQPVMIWSRMKTRCSETGEDRSYLCIF